MTRSQSRENAFLILFEQQFDQPLEEILELAKEVNDMEISEFSLQLVNGVNDNIDETDACFEQHLKKWKKSRLSKTALSILRLATYEMIFEDDIPQSVSINEAVELAKKYSSEEEAALINGVLGSISRQERKE